LKNVFTNYVGEIVMSTRGRGVKQFVKRKV